VFPEQCRRFAVHEKLGSLPIEEILKPVIALAKEELLLPKNKKIN
jgi:gamma-glutamyltranspeptidase/glutathione hydrolase